MRVINPKVLPDAIKAYGQILLTHEQIDLISRQLEAKCRDVED